jgi:hypothetical protein
MMPLRRWRDDHQTNRLRRRNRIGRSDDDVQQLRSDVGIHRQSPVANTVRSDNKYQTYGPARAVFPHQPWSEGMSAWDVAWAFAGLIFISCAFAAEKKYIDSGKALLTSPAPLTAFIFCIARLCEAHL